MHFVPSENLRIGHHDYVGFVTNETTRKRTNLESRPQTWFLRIKPVFAPNLFKPLALAGVITDDMHLRAAPQPAMQLAEEFPTLRLRHLNFRRTIHLGTKRLQTGEDRLLRIASRQTG